MLTPCRPPSLSAVTPCFCSALPSSGSVLAFRGFELEASREETLRLREELASLRPAVAAREAERADGAAALRRAEQAHEQERRAGTQAVLERDALAEALGKRDVDLREMHAKAARMQSVIDSLL